MIRDIIPQSPTTKLNAAYYRRTHGEARVDVDVAAAVLGMSKAFIARALDKPGTRPKQLTMSQILDLLEMDGFQETFIPRSKIPKYLLEDAVAPSTMPALAVSTREIGETRLEVGNARDLIRDLAPGSVQCVVTSSPYWGMRVYENQRNVRWADGERCPYGFEQTPEGFIRHTVELLYLMKPAITAAGSIWWNISDTYNTRTPIRTNARERLDAMAEKAGSRKGWTEHDACRHSAGHMYLDDSELSSIPPRIAERASRIGYKLKSSITWRKLASTPESTRSRVSRQSEYILHLAVSRTPYFDRDAWHEEPARIGGPNPPHESKTKITDIWHLASSTGQNGHGAEFPLALAGRCIMLTSKRGDLVLDPFVGSGTTALAATELRRRCIGFDISEKYIKVAEKRLRALAKLGRQPRLDADADAIA